MNDPFVSARNYARHEFDRLSRDAPKFNSTQLFSVEAYTAISLVILRCKLDLIDAIDAIGTEVTFRHNLAVHLHRELLRACCNHYFLAYEAAFKLKDLRTGGRSRSRSQAFPVQRWRRLFSKASEVLRPQLRDGYGTIGRVGAATFPWEQLTSAMRRYSFNVEPVRTGPPIKLVGLSVQLALLDDWSAQVHSQVADLFGLAESGLPRFSASDCDSVINDLLSRPAPIIDSYKAIVSGTLGREARTAALLAMEMGVPVITMHHGSHYLIFEEPYQPFYENLLSDAICGFGDISKQLERGILRPWPTVAGRSGQFYGRTDPEVRKIYTSRLSPKISAAGTLKNKVIVYMGTQMSEIRYGPYGDIHPYTYLVWQEKLLTWLEEQSGLKPLLRLHPKRISTRYDPIGYELMDRSMQDAIEAADIFVIDNPTTPLAYVAASSKPVLFADIGIRRLHSQALEILYERCHYARIDMNEPEEGLGMLAKGLERECEDQFTQLFSLGSDGEDEAMSVARAIRSMI